MGEGLVWIYKHGLFQSKDVSWDFVFQKALLQFVHVAFDAFGVLKLEPPARGALELGGEMAKWSLTDNVKPNGVMVTKEFIDGKLASTHWNQIESAKDAVHSSLLLFCLIGCGRKVFRGVKFKNHVVHVIALSISRRGPRASSMLKSPPTMTWSPVFSQVLRSASKSSKNVVLGLMVALLLLRHWMCWRQTLLSPLWVSQGPWTLTQCKMMPS